MLQSDIARLLASRPSDAALASLFSDHPDSPAAPRKPLAGRGPNWSAVGRAVLRRTRDVLLSQVPCEDMIFHTPPTLHFVRRRTQM